MRSPDRLGSGGAPASPDAVAAAGLCVGCGMCAAAAAGGAMRWTRHGFLAPDMRVRLDPTAFSATCPSGSRADNEDILAARHFPNARHRDARIGRFEDAYVGHAGEGEFRSRGSSGGMVSWLAARLLAEDWVDGVCHVVARPLRKAGEPLFAYQISRSAEAVASDAQSRYYPVELSGVVAEMRARPGRYAVVGIPCFIKAIRLAQADDALLAQRICFTLGLFCGHMKSARLAESYAWQMGILPRALSGFEFRVKEEGRPANWYRAEARTDTDRARRDWWDLADGDWGAGFFQNPACDCCDDVVAECADISFGDAWVEPYASDGRGTNVVVVRNRSLASLVRDGIARSDLQLKSVDADFIAATQAAGLRHRREGLAFRLSWHRARGWPKKRVEADAGPRWRRRLVYRLRSHIARQSHRQFRLARMLGWRGAYVLWARAMLGLYRAAAYSLGPLGRLFDRLEGSNAPPGGSSD